MAKSVQAKSSVVVKIFEYKLFNPELYGGNLEFSLTINDIVYQEQIKNGVLITQSERVKNYLIHSGWQLIESIEIEEE